MNVKEIDFVCPDCNEWVEACTCANKASATPTGRSRRLEIELNSAKVVGELFDRIFKSL